MGEVWLADHGTLHAQVCVKFISDQILATRPDALGRFEREASTTAQIKSPHVIQIYDYGMMADETPYMVMELLEGESLHELIEREGWASLDLTAEVLRQAGNALDLAHAKGIIHRDIKPQNVFVSHVHGEVHVKLLDFGIAKNMADEATELTQPGMVVGTIYYMSPERVGGSPVVDFRLDLWAQAVMAYKTLTGELPFEGPNVVDTCLSIREGKFRRPSKLRGELPPSVDEWFERAFHPDPEARFTSASQMARAFKEAISQSPPAEVRSSLAVPAARSAPGSARQLEGLGDLAARAWSQVTRRLDRLGIPRWEQQLGVGLLVVAFVVLLVISLHRCTSSPTTGPGSTASTGGPASGSVGATGTVAPSASGSGRARPTGTATAGATASVASPQGEPEVGTMVLVPGGEFWMGCDDANAGECVANEKPGRLVNVDPFYIDRTEVTVQSFAACVKAGACSTDNLDRVHMAQGGSFVPAITCNWGKEGREQHPINCVDHVQASAYCRFAGKRLPTEAEWEKAARGTDRRMYPWGNDPPSCSLAVMSQGGSGCGQQTTAPVGSKPDDRSPYEALDMAGNVHEWVEDWFGENAYRSSPSRNPTGPSQSPMKACRGGSWNDGVARMLRTTLRGAYSAGTRTPMLGFRCARNPG
jgi:eukaryotic-like serine/threonine-protein kinase